MNWSYSRHTDSICLVITVLTVLATLLFIGGERLGLTRITSDGGADQTGIFSSRDLDASWDERQATVIDLDSLSGLTSQGGAYVLDGDLYIAAKGTYVLRGTLTDHQVIVAADQAKVQLVLDGVNLHHQTLPPLVVQQADKVFVTLATGSTNAIAADDLASAAALAADVDAALYADADLAISR